MLGEGCCYYEGLCTIVCILGFGISTSRLKEIFEDFEGQNWARSALVYYSLGFEHLGGVAIFIEWSIWTTISGIRALDLANLLHKVEGSSLIHLI